MKKDNLILPEQKRLHSLPLSNALALRADQKEKVSTLTKSKYSVAFPQGFEPDVYYIQSDDGDFILIKNEKEFDRYYYREFRKIYKKNG